MDAIEKIKQNIIDGNLDIAQNELDTLLSLGPKNTSAIKLQARIHNFEGDYQNEAKLWTKILDIDAEDSDAINFFQSRFMDERENFYFTENLKEGRRYLAYPKTLFQLSFIGLMGCLIFIMTPRLASKFQEFNNPAVIISLFGVFIGLPWMAIIYQFITALRWVYIDSKGITFCHRLKEHFIGWNDFESIVVYFSMEHEDFLTMMLHPKNRDEKAVVIDLSEKHSQIKARSFFIADVRKYFDDIRYQALETEDVNIKHTRRY